MSTTNFSVHDDPPQYFYETEISPDATIKLQNKGVALHFKGQAQDAKIPTFGKSVPIEGSVEIGKPENVTAVTLKVCVLYTCSDAA